MTKVLLTGGSGFIATHILELLLQNGHSVVTTVRSQGKADQIQKVFSKYGESKLGFAIVEDITQPGAFQKAVISDPPFQAVIHTASPFTFNVKDIQKDLIDPAVVGTTSILRAVKDNAPSVERVVITSSFAAVCNPSKGNWPEKTFTEVDWNPMTLEDGLSNPGSGYTASKSFAEKAAWEFLKNEKPKFTISTICPTLVFGPIVPGIHSLSSLNTSNQLIRGITMGIAKEKIPNLGGYCFVDVRDVARAHVEAMQLPAAANQRFLAHGGAYNNRTIVELIRKNFPEYQSALPPSSVEGGDYPAEGVFSVDNTRSIQVLGIKYKALEEAVVDTVKSFQAMES
ncbi:hypothetical protein B0O99DRAFT_522334 [Bisporella sp. PMI_857]|nr:hypothetical protein B0O99DRAFT_522334 [Bisporella sp. PMI_857]